MDYLTSHEYLEQEEDIPEPATFSEQQIVTSLDDDLTTDGSIDSTETPTPSDPNDNTNDIVPSTSSGLEHSCWIRACLLVFKSLELTFQVLKPIMNAAVTIFGLGVGVGLIIGDSWRVTTTTTTTTTTNAAGSLVEEDMSTTTSPATATCRATIRRARPRVQEAPDFSLAGSQLPAQ
jgi:hypothetical protein